MSDYPSYRAPIQDQTRLCVPDLKQVEGLIGENRQILQAASSCWMDVPLATVREWARQDVLAAAQKYTNRYLPVGSQESSQSIDVVDGVLHSNTPFILSGHQPELYHPGVWFKNFLLSSIATRQSGIGINILVDHDLARNFSINVPTLVQDGVLHKETLSIDTAGPIWPWEYTYATDISKWDAFYRSVIDRLRSVGISEPLLCDLWPKIRNFLEQGWPIGESLSAARHIVEHSYGLQTLELPFSRLTLDRSFACFVGELLSRIQSVHAAYNEARHAYRIRHRIKNHLQPIPALARDEDWYEAPFWVYSASDPTRRGLWVACHGSRIRLSDRQRWEVEWSGNGDFQEWYAEWKRLNAAKISIRPRALTTTAFLRLAVSDLFIHGIGGGKYDQMTDRIVQSLWGLSAPKYLVATATLRLPMPFARRIAENAIGLSEADVLRRMRLWRFSPERLGAGSIPDDEFDSWCARKARLLARIPSGREKVAWHAEIQRLNARIRQQLQETESSLGELLKNARIYEREQAILRSREFSLGLFPSQVILERLKRLCGVDSDDTAPVSGEFLHEK